MSEQERDDRGRFGSGGGGGGSTKDAVKAFAKGKGGDTAEIKEAKKVGAEVGYNAQTFAEEADYTREEADREAENQLETRLGKPMQGGKPNKQYWTAATEVKRVLDRHYGK